MGRNHLIVGGCAVAMAGAAGLGPWETPALAALASGLVLSCCVLPDIDHKHSTVTRSWSILTRVVSLLVRQASVALYRATRTRHDPPGRPAHRTFTHTGPGAVTAGLLISGFTWWWAEAGVVLFALLFGIAGRAWARSWQVPMAAAGGLLAFSCLDLLSGAWSLWLVASTVGCVLHVGSDCVTKAGAPMAWPVPIAGQRWRMIGPPRILRFETDSAIERVVIRALVGVTAAVCWSLTAA